MNCLPGKLRITDYELRITDYGLRITDYELRITDYELPRLYKLDNIGIAAAM
jgi:hypothetical protein